MDAPGTWRETLRSLLRDPGYVLRYNLGTRTASPAIRTYPHQTHDLDFRDRVRPASITGKGPLGHPIWAPLPRIQADAGSGQGSALFDRQPVYGDVRRVSMGPVAPGRRGALERQPVTAWDRLLAYRAAALRS